MIQNYFVISLNCVLPKKRKQKTKEPNIQSMSKNCAYNIEKQYLLCFLLAVALIGFEEDTYTVDEGAGRVTVCAAVEEGSRELGRDVIVELSVQNGTALGE